MRSITRAVTGVLGSGGGGGGAPTDATYITQTADGTLSAEQALASLASGIMRVATATGVITSLTSSSDIAANISDETGTGVMVFGTAPTITTSLVVNEGVGASALTLTGATQTSSFPVLSATQTWNAAGTTFTALKLNVTNTASAAASLLLDLQVGGASQLTVSKIGDIATGGGTATNGNITVPRASVVKWLGGNGVALSFDNNLAADLLLIQSGSAASYAAIGGAGVGLKSTGYYGWSSSGTAYNTPDLALYRDGANALAQRNGTAAQVFRLYNTFTTVLTSGEWFKFDWATTANQFRFGAVKGSSAGTARVATWDYGDAIASATAAITVPATSGNITFGGGITLPGGATLLTTNTALTDGAGASTGTLTTAPSAGNPTKWIGINDNGTTRYVPAW